MAAINETWRVAQDKNDGTWEVGFEQEGRKVLIAYGLTHETALMICAAVPMRDALGQLLSWIEGGGDIEGKHLVIDEARHAYRSSYLHELTN